MARTSKPNPIKQRRRKADYDPNPPSCSNCKHLGRNRAIVLTGSVRWCVLLEFQLPTLYGVCDEWRGKDGTVLEVLSRPISTPSSAISCNDRSSEKPKRVKKALTNCKTGI